MSGESMRVPIPEMRTMCEKLFQAVGVSAANAKIVVDSLIQADLRGLDSHGVSRVPVYCDRIRDGWVNPNPEMQIIVDLPALVHLDAGNGLGAVSGTKAMDICIDHARKAGVAMCSVFNGNHFGIASYFTKRAALQGLIGFASSNNPANMAPWGGKKAMIGTNPFSIAVPAKKHRPLVLDMSSSIVARGKVNVAQIEGKPIPEGWAIDPDGNPTTDANKALDGSVLPFGRHKGYGIALMIDVLSGVLSGSAFGANVGQLWNNNSSTQDIGMCFAAVNVEALQSIGAFSSRVDQLIDELKASPTANNIEEILVPGEIEDRNEDYNWKAGIQVGPGVMKNLSSLAVELGVDNLITDAAVQF